MATDTQQWSYPDNKSQLFHLRITSYNVCYTKLLRSYGQDVKPVLVEVSLDNGQIFLPADGTSQWKFSRLIFIPLWYFCLKQDRITSLKSAVNRKRTTWVKDH